MISFLSASSSVTAFKSVGSQTHICLADGQVFVVAVAIQKLSEKVCFDLSLPVTPETNLEILHRPFEMTSSTWNALRDVLSTSTDFSAAIADHPIFTAWMGMDIDQLKRLPLQVFRSGGSTELQFHWPLNFRKRQDGFYQNLFIDGDYCLTARVDLDARIVEVNSGSIPGHIL